MLDWLRDTWDDWGVLGVMLLALIVSMVMASVALIQVATEERAAYLEYCQRKDRTKTEEDCQWEWRRLQLEQPSPVVIPMVIPIR